jgi:galactosamine-6-phosphate isomerase
MKLLIYKSYRELSRAAADHIANYIRQKPTSKVCIASGHTPLGVFECLVNDVKSGALDVSQCTFVSLDEWVGVERSDSGSCWSMVDKCFFTPLQIQKSNILFFDGESSDLQGECDKVNQFLEPEGLDIMLVGIGLNGHIAMNEPGTSFELHAHISQLAEETIQVGQKYFDKPTMLSKGITLGLQNFREARLPILMANGSKKASIMQKTITVAVSEDIPATIVQTIPQALVMIDQEAAEFIHQ